MKRKIANIVVIGVGAVRKIPLRRFAYLLWLRCGRVLDLKKHCRQQTEQEEEKTAIEKPCAAPAAFRGYGDIGSHPQIRITRKISWKTRRW